MGGISLNLIIAVIFGGIICASVYAYYSRKVLGDFLRKMAEKGCDGREEACELTKLGYSKIAAFVISLSLGENSTLRKYVGAYYTADEMAVLREEKGREQRYYIIPEKKETALERYNGKNMTLGKLLCGIAISVIAAILCATVFPYIITMVKGSTESFKAENEVVGARVEETTVMGNESVEE